MVLSCFRPKKLPRQEVIVIITAMNDQQTKTKVMETVADIRGVDSIAADVGERKLTVVGEVNPVTIVRKLKKIVKVDDAFARYI